MPAYVIGETHIDDPHPLQEYLAAVPGTLERYGGRFLAAGAVAEVLEGQFRPDTVAVIEFDTVEQARAWYSSPEYAAVRVLRHRSGESMVALVAPAPE